MTPEQREVLLLHFVPRTAEPGERIIRAGDDADGVYFISQGEVEVSVAGRQIKLGAGEVFGEMALLSGQPRSADVTALDYSTFAVLSERDFRQLLRKYPDIRAQIASLAAQRGETDRQVLADGSPTRGAAAIMSPTACCAVHAGVVELWVSYRRRLRKEAVLP